MQNEKKIGHDVILLLQHASLHAKLQAYRPNYAKIIVLPHNWVGVPSLDLNQIKKLDHFLIGGFTAKYCWP